MAETLVKAVVGGNYTHRLYAEVTSQNIGANTSVVAYRYTITRDVSSGSGAWWSDTRSFSVGCDGQLDTEAKTHDFRSTQVLTAVTGSKTITHNADGTKTIDMSFDGPTTYVSSGFPRTSGSGTFTLPTIPRASTPTVTGGTSFDAGTTITINTNRASTSFTHTLTYSFGNSTGQIGATKFTTDTVTWDVPLSLLSNIPNATSGTGTFTLTTFSGSTNVGSKTLQFTLRAPSSVVPTVGSVTHSEGTTSPAVATLIGGYVESVSKLAVVVTGSAGIYGSTITSTKVEFAGQTFTGPAGTDYSVTTGVIGQDGTLALKVTVTDSRARTAVSSINVTVLNYAAPSITTATAARALVGGTLDPNGTYLKVDLSTSVTSLIVGTQKNNLTWSIKTRLRGSTTAWTSISNSAGATTAELGVTNTNVIGTYSTASSYEVRLAAVDKLGTEAAVVLLVGTGGAVLHLSKTVDGIGVGKYHEQGSVDALGHMYQNNGLPVLDTSDFATSAEVQSGTSSLKAVTPAALAGSGTYRYVQTVTFTANGTFTKANYPWLKAVRVRVQAAGGAGGGAPSNPANQHSSGGGGGGGGYAEKFLQASALAASETVTIGAAGAPGAAGAGGGNAANSSFGTHAVATGGFGGGIAASSGLMIGALGGNGGAGTTGDLLVDGQSGGMGSGYATLGHGGLGGSAVLGGGGRGAYTGAGSGTGQGAPGGQYGGGGGGSTSNSGGAAIAGSAGGPGIIIVDLYA